jgi:N-acetyl-alpha-D-muramate 1-phosphate uridylyltransferase
LPMLPDHFFVLYGDSYLICDYEAVEAAFRHSGLAGMMTVYRNNGMYDCSNVEYDGDKILRYDKRNRTSAMQYIDYGLGGFQRAVFEVIPAGEYRDLAAVYQDLLGAGKLAAFESHERFYEIGSPEGLKDTMDFLSAQVRRNITTV